MSSLPLEILASVAKHSSIGYEGPENEILRLAERPLKELYTAILNAQEKALDYRNHTSALGDDGHTRPDNLAFRLTECIANLPHSPYQLSESRLEAVKAMLTGEELPKMHPIQLTELVDGHCPSRMHIQWQTSAPETVEENAVDSSAEARHFFDPQQQLPQPGDSPLHVTSPLHSKLDREEVQQTPIPGGNPLPGFEANEGHWRHLPRPFNLTVEGDAERCPFEVTFTPNDPSFLPMQITVGRYIKELSSKDTLRQHLELARGLGYYRERTEEEVQEGLYPSILHQLPEEDLELQKIQRSRNFGQAGRYNSAIPSPASQATNIRDYKRAIPLPRPSVPVMPTEEWIKSMPSNAFTRSGQKNDKGETEESSTQENLPTSSHSTEDLASVLSASLSAPSYVPQISTEERIRSTPPNAFSNSSKNITAERMIPRAEDDPIGESSGSPSLEASMLSSGTATSTVSSPRDSLSQRNPIKRQVFRQPSREDLKIKDMKSGAQFTRINFTAGGDGARNVHGATSAALGKRRREEYESGSGSSVAAGSDYGKELDQPQAKRRASLVQKGILSRAAYSIGRLFGR